jgi:hypothetical protein
MWDSNFFQNIFPALHRSNFLSKCIKFSGEQEKSKNKQTPPAPIYSKTGILTGKLLDLKKKYFFILNYVQDVFVFI